MKFFIPEYGNYYHFMTESVMGLYRVLSESGKLTERDCEIWYKGRYVEIVQLFSRHPVHLVDHPEQVPEGVTVLPHFRPKQAEEWQALKPMFQYLERLFPALPLKPGITLVKRINRRIYSDHDALKSALKQFGMPVREAVMERMPLREQINLMRYTLIMVGPHGSGETNLVFMPPGALIIELYPMGFFDRVFSGLASAFGHELVEIESQVPSVIGRKPSPKVQEFLDSRGWPTRRDHRNWTPDRMEMGRVLRDVASFSLDPAIVIRQLQQVLHARIHRDWFPTR